MEHIFIEDACQKDKQLQHSHFEPHTVGGRSVEARTNVTPALQDTATNGAQVYRCVLCSRFPPWLCEYGSTFADATHMCPWIMHLVLLYTVFSFLLSLKDAELISAAEVARQLVL